MTFMIPKTLLVNIFGWTCAAVLWVYMSVTLVGAYKNWYFAAGVAVILAAFLSLSGILRSRGMLKAVGLVLIYYGYLFATALWAEYPQVAVWSASTELIFVAVFALFYLLSLNGSQKRMADFFTLLSVPAALVFVASPMVDPEIIRLGGYAQNFVPFALLFCILELLESLSLRNVVLAMACMMMLALGMSRTPILIAALGGAMMLLSVRRQWRVRPRHAVAALLIVAFLAVAVGLHQPLRLYAGKTFSRLVYQDVAVGEQVIEAEAPDVIRWAVFAEALSLLETNWLWGIGYMNFMPSFGQRYEFIDYAEDRETIGMNLHNTLQTWVLEGGGPCLVIMTVLLWRYFRILRLRIRRTGSRAERSYYRTYAIAMICLLVMGLFHQVHQFPLFYALLGAVYALGAQDRAAHSRGGCGNAR